MKPQSRVYFIQSTVGGPIKIGRSVDVDKRLRQFQAGSPLILLLLCAQPGGHVEENALHRRFAADALGNEWFAVSPELVDLVASLGGAASSKVLEGEVKRPRRERRPPKVKPPLGPSRGSHALREALRQDGQASQSSIARRIDVTPQAVSQWCRWTAAPSLSNTIALERLLGIPAIAWSEPAPDIPAPQSAAA